MPADTRAETAKAHWLDVRQMDSRRALILMGLGALIGLAFAGFALFTAKGTTTLVVPADAVAIVNQQPLSRVDYLTQLQAVYGADLAHATAQQKKQALEDMIREELFVQRGKELDVATFDPDVRNAMVAAVEQQAAFNAITNHPSEPQLQAYYASHKAKYASEGTMELRELIFPTATGQAAAQALASGMTPDAAIAAFKGQDSKRVQGEEFYFAAKIHLGDAVFAVAQGLRDGAASAAVALPDGVHVLVMIKNHPPIALDYADARDRVLNDYSNDSIKRLQAGDAGFLRKRANVLVAKDMQ